MGSILGGFGDLAAPYIPHLRCYLLHRDVGNSSGYGRFSIDVRWGESERDRFLGSCFSCISWISEIEFLRFL